MTNLLLKEENSIFDMVRAINKDSINIKSNLNTPPISKNSISKNPEDDQSVFNLAKRSDEMKPSLFNNNIRSTIFKKMENHYVNTNTNIITCNIINNYIACNDTGQTPSAKVLTKQEIEFLNQNRTIDTKISEKTNLNNSSFLPKKSNKFIVEQKNNRNINFFINIEYEEEKKKKEKELMVLVSIHLVINFTVVTALYFEVIT